MDREQYDREKALAEAKWERTSVVNYLDDRGYSHPNPHYVKRELIDGVVVESMPNKPIVVEEKK